MEKNNLVVAGFSQPSVSRALTEFPGNTEEGLSQRFLWIFPKPSYAHFATLEPNRESMKYSQNVLVGLLVCGPQLQYG